MNGKRMGRTQVAVVVVGVAGLLLSACSKAANTGSGGGTSGSGVQLQTKAIGSVGTVLATAKGFTLYHNTEESGSNIACTGTCASTWPPLLAAAGTTPQVSGASGTWGTIKRPDGQTQLTYNNQPLYTYSGDTGAGQANGQGLGGIWFAETASGAAASSSPSSSGGGGYYHP
jgi:predicted lipoprotein with Yx(FWY)xxD motif